MVNSHCWEAQGNAGVGHIDSHQFTLVLNIPNSCLLSCQIKILFFPSSVHRFISIQLNTYQMKWNDLHITFKWICFALVAHFLRLELCTVTSNNNFIPDHGNKCMKASQCNFCWIAAPVATNGNYRIIVHGET